MDLLEIIGSVASIGSLPLAIYFFIKQRENKLNNVLNTIVRVLLYQIGSKEIPNKFEIETVMRSKLREAKFRDDIINIKLVIENMISEIIENPLIEGEYKAQIIPHFKRIYECEISNKSKSVQAVENKEQNPKALHLKPALNNERDIYENSKAYGRITFIIYLLILMIIMVISIFSTPNSEGVTRYIVDIINNMNYESLLFISFSIGGFSAVISFLFSYIRKKK